MRGGVGQRADDLVEQRVDDAIVGHDAPQAGDEGRRHVAHHGTGAAVAVAFEMADARLDGGKLRLLGIDAARHGGAALVEQAAHALGRGIVLQDLADALQRQAERAQHHQPVQVVELVRPVGAIAGRGIDMGRPQKADRLVVAQRLDRHAAAAGEFTDPEHHGPTVASPLTGESSQQGQKLSPEPCCPGAPGNAASLRDAATADGCTMSAPLWISRSTAHRPRARRPAWTGGAASRCSRRCRVACRPAAASRPSVVCQAAIRLLARLPDGLLRPSSNRHLRGEWTAILRFALRLHLRSFAFGRGAGAAALGATCAAHPAKTNIAAALKKGRAYQSPAIGHRVDKSGTCSSPTDGHFRPVDSG